jgi:hypothetical protein
MMGRKTLREVREELEAALTGTASKPQTMPGRGELMESLSRILGVGTGTEAGATPSAPRDPTRPAATKPA